MKKFIVDATPNEIASVLEQRVGIVDDTLPKNLDMQMTLLIEYVRIKYGITVTRMSKILNENYANNNTYYITRVRRAGEGVNSAFTASQYLRFMLAFGLDIDDIYRMLDMPLATGDALPFLNGDEIKAFAGCTQEMKDKLLRIIAESETESGEVKKAAERALNPGDE